MYMEAAALSPHAARPYGAWYAVDADTASPTSQPG